MRGSAIPMRSVSALLLAGLGLGLGGCLLGPDYVRPTVPTPATFRFETTEVAEVANAMWWEQFKDPVLNDLIAAALADNKDVKIAAARVDQFLGQFVTTRSALFPQINAGFEASRQRVSVAGLPTLPAGVNPVFNEFQAPLSAAWEIDFFGKVRRQTESARASLLASEEGRRATILSLVASVASSYINLRDLDQQLSIAKATTESRAGSVKVFQARFAGGDVSQMELAQSESEYEASLATIPQIETQIAQQEDALSVLLGHNPGPILRGRELTELAVPPVPAGLPSDLLQRRPDIASAERKVAAANANIGVQRAAYFPSLTLSASGAQGSTRLSDLFNASSFAWSLGVSLAETIFDGGARTARVEEAQATWKQSVAQYRQTVLTAFSGVEDQLSAASSLEQQQALRKVASQAADQTEQEMQNRYKQGLVAYTDVVTAQATALSARRALMQVSLSRQTAAINMVSALGGGWSTQQLAKD
jgi:multidrug efflux system outer membrane protein